MCNFLDRLLADTALTQEDDLGQEDDLEAEMPPHEVMARLRALLEPRRVDCLGDFLLIYFYKNNKPRFLPEIKNI